MLLVHGLLLLCSLFAVGTCTCYSTNPQPPETCYQLFEEFESALTRNKLNLFNLEALFSPSLDTVPSLANITYVQYYNMSPEVEPCPRSPDDNSSFINVTETYTAVLGWSNSGVYDVISPITLHVLQPQSLISLMKVLNSFHSNSDLDSLLWDGTKPLGGVVLNLNLSLQCIPTEAQVNSSLVRTTSKLTTYADVRENSRIGYAYLMDSDDAGSRILIVLLYLLIFSFVCFMGYILIKPPENKLKDFLMEKKTKIAALATTIFVVLEFVCEIILRAIWFSNIDGYSTTQLVVTYKFATSLTAFILFLILLCLSIILYTFFNKDVVHVFLLFPLANFVVFASLEIIPFVIFSFVHPFWASSFLFIITECLVIAHVIYIYGPAFKNIFCYKDTTSKCKLKIFLDIYYGVLIPVCVIYILFLYLIVFEALIVHGRGIASSGTIKTIISFLPPLFLPFTDWFISYIYKAVGIADKKTKTSNPHSSETTSVPPESGTGQHKNNEATSYSEERTHQEMQEPHTVAQQENQGPDGQQPTVQGERAPLVNTAAQSYNTC